MDKIKLGYFFRIDDITPGMNWENLNIIENIFEKYEVKPIIGVVPDNKDLKLDGYGKIDNFWGKIKQLQKKGWIIAQHGFEHKYETKNSGIIGLNDYSEFAGLSYDEQFEKISNGKKILENNLGIEIKWWMAPAHSFDEITCKILNKLGFEYITDGISLFPFEKYSLKWLPQQIWKPKKKGFGIWTICLHVNKYDKKILDEIEVFCKENKSLIISDPEKLNYKNNFINNLSSSIYKILFLTEQFLYKRLIYNFIRNDNSKN